MRDREWWWSLADIALTLCNLDNGLTLTLCINDGLTLTLGTRGIAWRRCNGVTCRPWSSLRLLLPGQFTKRRC